MGYVSFEDAQRMSRASLAEALTVGGSKSEQAIMERYEARLPTELRQEVPA